MRILGVSDGPDAGAALVVDDRVVGWETQYHYDRRPGARRFPWDAIDALMRQQGVTLSEIDGVAVAGRFSPPLAIRRHPVLRRLVGGPFSGALDLGVFYQALLRQTGWGAFQADLAAEFLAERFAERGLRGRVQLVDVHTALANAAYRTQSDDDQLIVTLHPMGDGVALAVHEGKLGQIDRVFEQKGFASLHVHLERCSAALGLANPWAMWRSAGPDFDPILVDALSTRLRAEGGKLSRNRYPLQERSPVFGMLSRSPRSVGAASVVENVRRAVCGIVAHHVRKSGIGDVAVAGAVFHNAQLVADLAAVEGVRSVRCPSRPGYGSLAIGAATYASGIAMAPLHRAPDPSVEALEATQSDRFDAEAVAAELARGGRVLWWRGDQAARCVLSSAEVGAPSGQRLLWDETPDDGEVVHRDALRGAIRNGAASVRVDAAFADRVPVARGNGGRFRVVPAEESALKEVLAALRAARGVGAVCFEPLARGGMPVPEIEPALAWSRNQGIGMAVVGS